MRLPAIADRAVWEKVTKGRVEERWDSVAGKVWKDTGGNQEEILSIEKFDGYKTEAIEVRETPALRNKVNKKEHSEIYTGLREEIGRKNYLRGPMDYAKTLKLRLGGVDLR